MTLTALRVVDAPHVDLVELGVQEVRRELAAPPAHLDHAVVAQGDDTACLRTLPVNIPAGRNAVVDGHCRERIESEVDSPGFCVERHNYNGLPYVLMLSSQKQPSELKRYSVKSR